MNQIPTTRRAFLTRLGLGAMAIGAAAAAQACGKQGAGDSAGAACDDTAGLPAGDVTMRKTLQYVDVSVQAGKSCALCLHYVAPEGGAACGGCKLFKGPVAPAGFCTSFFAKPA